MKPDPVFIFISQLLLLLLQGNLSGKAFDLKAHRSVPMLNLTYGVVGIADDLEDPLQYGIEYQGTSFSEWKIVPVFGYMQTELAANYVYADIERGFWLAHKFVLIPSSGLGAFNNSRLLNLGSPLEFRSGLSIAYETQSGYRFGIGLYHLSNGGIADTNPGTELLVASTYIPFGKLTSWWHSPAKAP